MSEEMKEVEVETAAAPVVDASIPCPCGSGKTYGECCRAALDEGAWPETPEALVRARYTAYATGHYQFLVDTTLPSSRRPELSAEALARSAGEVSWVRLNIVKTGGTASDNGVDYDLVDFYAYYGIDGSLRQLGERAFFTTEEGKLYYAQGLELRPEPFVRTEAKVGRNDPCPCGSGKKYKKCCGRNEA